MDHKILGAGTLVTLALFGVLSFLLISGINSAIEARDGFQSLQEQLSSRGLIELADADIYEGLAAQFSLVERSAGRARSRLWFTGLFTWLPRLGDRIRDSRAQLDLAFYLARAGGDLATAYQAALGSPDAPSGGSASGAQITRALEKAAPILQQVELDLERARLIRDKLEPGVLSDRHASLIDTYLLQIQTLTYISQEYPQIIGLGYEINLELTGVQDLVANPLQVLTNPEAVDQSFDNIILKSRALSAELALLKTSARTNLNTSAATRQGILDNIELMGRGINLLALSTGGAQGLVKVARAVEEHGLLSRAFAGEARGALKQAESQLSLAQVEAAAISSLLAQRDGQDQVLQSLLVFGGAEEPSLRSAERALERAVESTRFLQAFLGFRGPRNYLILAQNQQEIRASGGFIGVAVQMTVDQGQIVDLVYHDSTTVDLLPPAYPNNPLPPEPLYWYLWMGRLLFRDANWSPNFPTAAGRLADIYRLGQTTQVDGVITGSKALMVDLVELLGDVRVPDLSQPLTRRVAQDYTDGDLPYKCSARHVSTRGKRCFDEDVFFALRDRLTAPISRQERAQVIQLFQDALERHNILVHIFDATEGSLLWDLGWNGAIRPVDHDYLLVVDSSLPGHTTEFVQRHWDYQVSLEFGKPVNSKLRLRYIHQGALREDRVCRQSEPESSNCYWNYFRIYLPRVATNVTAPPVPLDPGAEKLIWGYPDADSGSLARSADVGPARLTEVGGFIAVPPDSVTTIPIEYQLPWKVVRSTGEGTFEYRLLVQKQPGIDRDRVSVAVELPAGAELLKASPDPSSRSVRWLTFDFGLTKDTQVVVAFKAPGGE